jgi:tetratricopeptide (TPR) repeat protein
MRRLACAPRVRASFMAALVLAALSGAPYAVAADVSAHATLDRAQVAVGEAADLGVTIEGTQDAAAPTLADVDGLHVRYVGPATQLSIVNGRSTAQVTHHFSVTATKPGTFTIGPITVESGGARYDAGSVTLEAAGAGAARAGAAGRDAAGGAPLTLVLASPRTRAYLHEHVPATLTLTVGAVDVADVHYPTLPGDGFALEPLRDPVQRREQRGQGTVQIVEFKSVLTPLRSGDLTVGPATMELSVPARRGGRDPFFDRFLGGDPFGARRAVTLQSEPLHLEVLPLPDAGKPADFSGAVGRFTLRVEAGPRALEAGDPVTVTTTIEGDGNLEGAQAPMLAATDTLKTYPVQTMPQTASSPGTAARAEGARAVFEQVVIPERAGAVTLAAPRFSYFDPEAGTYRTLTAAPIVLDVQPPAQAAEAPVGAPAAAPARPSTPETLGRDIVFIKDTPGNLQPAGHRLYRSVTFWALQLVPLTIWALIVVVDRRRLRLRADPRLARFSTAGRSARRAIAAAEATLQAGDRTAFYDRLVHAMREYLSAKLDLPPGAVTADSVVERARGRGVPAEVADGLGELFASCERVRFAPAGEVDGDMRQALARAESLVRALERERRGVAAPVIVALLLAAVSVTALVPIALHAQAPPPAADTPNTIFFRANTLYGEERYADAAVEYERILTAGFESGPLYFNLGNAYFKTADVGRAVLAYERARRLMPGDPDLQANLGFAQSGVAPDAPSLIARLVFPLATRAATDALLLAASALYVTLVLLAIVRRLLPAMARSAARAALALALVLAVVASSAVYRLVTIDLPARAVVVAPEGATVRFEPSAGGTAHFTAKTGAVLRVLSIRDEWAQVARADGTRGWIPTDAIALL